MWEHALDLQGSGISPVWTGVGSHYVVQELHVRFEQELHHISVEVTCDSFSSAI